MPAPMAALIFSSQYHQMEKLWHNTLHLRCNYGAQHEHKYRQDILSVMKTTWVRGGK